jgi:hypothetical protein
MTPKVTVAVAAATVCIAAMVLGWTGIAVSAMVLMFLVTM